MHSKKSVRSVQSLCVAPTITSTIATPVKMMIEPQHEQTQWGRLNKIGHARSLFALTVTAMLTVAALTLWPHRANAAREDLFSEDDFSAIEIDQTKVNLSTKVLGSPEVLWSQGRAQEAIWALEQDHRYAEAETLTEKIKTALESDQINFFHSISTDREDSSPHRVTFASGLQALVKSIDDTGQESIENEVAAFRVDRFFGFNRVPITVKRQIGDSFFVVQLWMPDAHPSHLEFRDKPTESFAKYADIWLLDYLLGSWDRHGRNSLLTPDQYLVAIDNGRIGRENIHRDTLIDSIALDNEIKNRLAHFNEHLLDYELLDLMPALQREQLIARIKRLNKFYSENSPSETATPKRGYLSRERGVAENKKLSLENYKKPTQELNDHSGDEYDLEFELNPIRVLHHLVGIGDTSGLFTQVRGAKTLASRLTILDKLRKGAEQDGYYRRVYDIFLKDPNMAVLLATVDIKFCENAIATPSILGMILGQYRQPQYAELGAKPLLNLLSVEALNESVQTYPNLIKTFLESAKANPSNKVYYDVLLTWLEKLNRPEASDTSKAAVKKTAGAPTKKESRAEFADRLSEKIKEQISTLIKEKDHARLALTLVALNYVRNSAGQKILLSWITQILENYRELPKEIAETLFGRGQNFLTLFLEQAANKQHRDAIRSLFNYANKDHTGLSLQALNERRIMYQDILNQPQTNMCQQIVAE